MNQKQNFNAPEHIRFESVHMEDKQALGETHQTHYNNDPSATITMKAFESPDEFLSMVHSLHLTLQICVNSTRWLANCV